MIYSIILCDVTLIPNLKSKNRKRNGKENRNKLLLTVLLDC